MVKEINDDNYKELIKDNKIVIDCYASWCGPCRMLSPIIEELSNELKDIKFYKIDIDKNEEITKEYDIMSIPTLLIFNNNKLEKKVIGFRTKDELINIIK